MSVIIGSGTIEVKRIASGIRQNCAMKPYDPLVLFGENLRRLRKARGWSQEALALESQLARSYVGGIERGQRNIALVNICVLADTLGVAPSEMLNFQKQASTGQSEALAKSERSRKK